MVEAASLEDATERAGALPMVRAGLLQPPTIVPLQPYRGFGPRA
jgi:hypothetical protein